MDIGDRIKLIRKEKSKLNQSQFASILSISQTHISKIEANVDTPSDKVLHAIEIEFSISFDWLKYGTGEEAYSTSTNSKEVLLKDSVREVKLYLDNCTDIEFMTFFSALLKLLDILIMVEKEGNNISDKLIVLSDMLTTI